MRQRGKERAGEDSVSISAQLTCIHLSYQPYPAYPPLVHCQLKLKPGLLITSPPHIGCVIAIFICPTIRLTYLLAHFALPAIFPTANPLKSSDHGEVSNKPYQEKDIICIEGYVVNAKFIKIGATLIVVLFEQRAKQVIQILFFVLKLENWKLYFFIMNKILVNNQDNPLAVKQRDTDTKEPQIKKKQNHLIKLSEP